MKFLIFVTAWCLLFLLCWPLALLVLGLAPVILLISVPLRLVGVACEAIVALLRAILMLPARLLGYRDRPDKACA